MSCGTYSGYQKHRKVRQNACKECAKARLEYMKAWNKANNEKRRQYDRDRGPRLVPPKSRRTYHLKFRYNITPEEWETRFEIQGFACACCRTQETYNRERPWHVDHNHITNEIRGICCIRCNRLVGQLGDNARSVASNMTMLLQYLATSGDKLTEAELNDVITALKNYEICGLEATTYEPKPRHSPDPNIGKRNRP